MLKKRIDQLLSVRRNQLILASVIMLLLFLGGLKLLSTSNKPSTYICDSNSCSGGCCVKNKCLPKSIAIADYTCLGEGKWRAADGKVSLGVPEAVEKSVKQAEKSVGDSSSAAPLEKAEAQKIASRIIDWLDTMRNEDGRYYLYETCDEYNNCQKSQDTNKQLGIYVVWARYRNYINTKNQKDYINLVKDLDTLTTPVIGFPAQNDFLNCKLMYEISQSGIFDKDNSKEKVDDICLGSIHYGPELDEFSRTLGQNKYNLEPQINEVISGKSIDKWEIANPQSFNKYALYASDLTYVYKWQKTTVDLEAAKYYFKMALQIFSNKNPNLGDSELGLGALDLYRETKDQRYMDFIDYYLDYKTNTKCISLDDCAYYIMFLDEYYALTKKAEIRNRINGILQMLIKEGYDKQKGVFHSINGKTYTTLTNALIAATVSKYLDE